MKFLSVSLDSGEPGIMRGIFSPHDREKPFLQRGRHDARLSGPDPAIVDFSDWSQLGSSPRHKYFVGDVHFIAREPFFDHDDALLPCQFDDGTSCNAFEDGRQGGRLDPAVNGVVFSNPSRTMKIFSPVPSDTYPSVSRRMASS